MPVTTLARIKYGSHLFGTATPQSDFDYKVVCLPSAEDILLGRVVVSSRDGTTNALVANKAGDIDFDTFDLMKFVEMLIRATPESLEILFAPDSSHMQAPHRAFRELQKNSDRVVSSDATKFLGMCRNQALNFGVRGEKMAAARQCLMVLKEIKARVGKKANLVDHLAEILERTDSRYIKRETVVSRDRRVHELLTICIKSLPINDTLGRAFNIAETVVNNYGERTRITSITHHNWKAYSHALRVGYELKELLTDGRMTLPGPYAPRLLDVKLGLIPIDEVGDEIEAMIAELESLTVTTSIPKSADVEFLYDFVCQEHARCVRGVYGYRGLISRFSDRVEKLLSFSKDVAQTET